MLGADQPQRLPPLAAPEEAALIANSASPQRHSKLVGELTRGCGHRFAHMNVVMGVDVGRILSGQCAEALELPPTGKTDHVRVPLDVVQVEMQSEG